MNFETVPNRITGTLFSHAGTSSYLHPVSESDLKAGETYCSSRRKYLVCLPEFADVALELMAAAHKLVHCQTPAEAKELFLVLTRLLENLL